MKALKEIFKAVLIYFKGVAILIVLIMVIGVIGSLGDSDTAETTQAAGTKTQTAQVAAAEEKAGGVKEVDKTQPAPPQKRPKKAATWRDRDQSTMAYHMAADWVRGRLRAPATADFPGIFQGRADHVTRLDGQRYRIRSYVDAQNGFGAQVRTRFTAEVEQTGKDAWRLLSLQLHE